jgi:hypothetical protein
LIAFTPIVSVRAKEFRRWIDENSPYRDEESPNRRAAENFLKNGHPEDSPRPPQGGTCATA